MIRCDGCDDEMVNADDHLLMTAIQKNLPDNEVNYSWALFIVSDGSSPPTLGNII